MTNKKDLEVYARQLVFVGWGWGQRLGMDGTVRRRRSNVTALRVERVRAGRCCSSCLGFMCISQPIYWPQEMVSSGAGPGGWGCGPL